MIKTFAYLVITSVLLTCAACSNTNPLDPKALDAPPHFGKIPPMTQADREAKAKKDAKKKKTDTKTEAAAA